MLQFVHGLTEVQYEGGYLTVKHHGNMGHSIASVNKDLEGLGFPTVQDFKNTGRDFVESGSPDSEYSFKIRAK